MQNVNITSLSNRKSNPNKTLKHKNVSNMLKIIIINNMPIIELTAVPFARCESLHRVVGLVVFFCAGGFVVFFRRGGGGSCNELVNPFLPDGETTFSRIFFTFFYSILKFSRPEHDIAMPNSHKEALTHSFLNAKQLFPGFFYIFLGYF